MALIIAVFIHVGVVVVLPERLLQTAVSGGDDVTDEAFSVEIQLDEPLLPEQMRFVEANPDAPENEPDRKEQYSYRSQQAADQHMAEDSLDAPRVEGEEQSQKIIQGAMSPAAPLPTGVYSSVEMPGEDAGTDGGKAGQATEVLPAPPLPLPDFLKQETETDGGSGSSVELSGEAHELQQEPDPIAPVQVYQPPDPSQLSATVTGDGNGGAPHVKPMPRPRPRLAPELLHGPLMTSVGSASRRGSLAIDATFSEFGEYQQQFYAAVQVGWYQEIDFFQPIDTATRVMVRFTMYADGSIQNVEAVQSTASEVATVICESALSKRSPFRPWTKEMVEVFGESRTLHVVFHYR